jgi:hypothetical protein
MKSSQALSNREAISNSRVGVGEGGGVSTEGKERDIELNTSGYHDMDLTHFYACCGL